MVQSVHHVTNPHLVPQTRLVVSDKGHGDKTKRVVIPSRAGGTYGRGASGVQSVARFDIASANGFLHFSDLALEFDVAGDATKQINGDANAFISRMRLISGNGIELADDTQYNLNAMQQQILSGSSVVSAKKWAGLGDYIVAAQDSGAPLTTTARHLVVRPNLGIFKALEGVHMPLFDRLTLEVTFEVDATVFNTSTGTTNKYTVTNPELHVSLTPMTNSHINALQAAAAKGDFVYSYPRVYHTSKGFAAANDNMSLQYIADSVRAATAVWRLTADTTSQAKNSLSKYQLPPALSSLQWVHGSDFYPEQSLQDEESIYENSLASLGLQNDISTGSLITRALYTGADSESAPPLFIVRQRFSRSDSPLTGISIRHTPLQIKLNCSATSGLEINMMVEYDASYTPLANNQGVVRV